ncbi:uncharacterized protein BXZ73DRAFT_97397 [Epithele typhae]|uniref:uncharacterized protein n=1 Tax=Epithele typhae TaxID=378194 RepID=UPI002008D72D|nr:uncharacterized protein BXZ73DRAFT_97397 [Epithele typhae]KAH9943355.1 hypothetical protein BXZ73DRAFT_97397 [Epithele typhae]
MASAAPSPAPSGGVNSSMWAGQPPSSKPGWRSNGEPGSAFRGVGRGRSGRGGGRGGRGGRGGGRGNGVIPLRTDDKGPKNAAHPKTAQSTSSASPAPTATTTSAPSSVSAPAPAPSFATRNTPAADASPSATSKSAASRPKDAKAHARKASESKQPRKLPPIVIEPPKVASTASPTSATTPNRTRKKRAQNRSTSSMSMSSKKSPSTESSTSFLKPEKSPVIAKDLPPHLVAPPPLPKRRPSTSSTTLMLSWSAHIDWAGDDDDSLPDLDDWGVKSVPGRSLDKPLETQPDLLSPMLADTLKPLPNVGSPLVASFVIPHSEGQEDDPPSAAPPAKKDPPSSQPRANGASKSRLADKAPYNKKVVNGKKAAPIAEAASTTDSQTLPFDKDATKQSPGRRSVPLLHPSLPAKPVDAMKALPPSLPRKPVPSAEAPEAPALVDAPPVLELAHVSMPDGVTSVVPVEAPQDPTPGPNADSDASGQGVFASMHAPARSAPSHITTHHQPNPSFHPTHGRAHTVGRPGFRVPFSPSQNSFLDGGVGNGDERATRRERVNHARTHSSPPTAGPGHGHSRSVHTVRPVITGDALSKLARTLGGAPGPRPKPAPAAATEAVAAKE